MNLSLNINEILTTTWTRSLIKKMIRFGAHINSYEVIPSLVVILQFGNIIISYCILIRASKKRFVYV